MPPPAGTRVGPYEIVSPLGAGGMGEVYRARDATLGRFVAVKVLPNSFSHDAERRARLLREAQMPATLNHPYIAAIYGWEDSWGKPALVMELVDGKPLTAHISRHGMAPAKALKYAAQIAAAMEGAHRSGVIHRDLKPSNVMITAADNVKLLDFGLAKLSESPMIDAGAATRTMAAMTEEGKIVEPWLTCRRRDSGTRICVTPVRPDGSFGGEPDWTEISPPGTSSTRPRFAPDGNSIFYLSNERGVLTLVSQELDPASKRPRGAATRLAPVQMFPATVAYAIGASTSVLEVSSTRVFFNAIEARSNVWMTSLE